MFKTYQDQLAEIEGLYNDKQYNATIVDCARLAEKVVGVFFNHFHTFLKTREENLRYLDFEKEAGEKYQAFLTKPTIGVGIGFYNRLLTLFPDKPGLNQDIRVHLNTINTIRNAHVHSHDATSGGQEAGQILDALEKILKSTNLLKASVDVVGVPLKYYLVFKSIEAKFERSDTEDDFKKIVNDASKVIPHLIDVLLNKTYHALSIAQKEKLIDLYFSTDRKERSLSDYYKLCKEVGIFDNLDRSDILRESLEEISGEQETFSRRLTRHFVNAIQVIIELTENPHAHHFLEYANAVKKRYLRSRKLSENDRLILQEKASESGISRDLARRIEEAVVETIDKELILYQTLTEEGVTPEPGQSPTVSASGGRISLRPVAGVVLAIVVLTAWFFLREKSTMEEYEVVYLSGDTQTAAKLAEKQRSLDNVGANFYYILSTYFNNQGRFPEELRADYRKLLKDNPGSAEANFYLGLIYSYHSRHRQELDSAFLLTSRAKELGMKGVYYDQALFVMLSGLGFSTQAVAQARILENYEHTRAKRLSSDAFLNISRDTVKAILLLKESIHLYDQYMGPYIALSEIYVAKKQFDSASFYLELARKVRGEDPQVANGLANIYTEQGRFVEAKQLYREAISSFGADNPDFYSAFALLLLDEDSVAQGLSVISAGLGRFPKNQNFLWIQNSLNRRKELLKSPKAVSDSIRWNTNLADALRLSQEAKLPILLFLFRPNDGFSSIMERVVLADSAVIQASKKFIPLKINPTQDPDLRRKYEIDIYQVPQFLVLSMSGERIGRLSKIYNPRGFSVALINESNRLVSYINHDPDLNPVLMEVSNFEDAKIIAAKRDIPILVVVGDKRSPYSTKLTTESITHPLFKAAAQKLVFLHLNSNSNDPLLKTLDVNTYPSLHFFHPNGKQLAGVFGFIPGIELATLTQEVSKHYVSRTPMPSRVNWFYDLDEAKAHAIRARKSVFVTFSSSDCEHCQLMDEAYQDTSIVNELDRNYASVTLKIEDKTGMATWNQYGVYAIPAQLVLNENGNEINRHAGSFSPIELKQWLDIHNKTRIASLLGVKEYDSYLENVTVGTEMVRRGAYQSGINVLMELMEKVDDDPDVLGWVGSGQFELEQNEEAIRTFEKGFSAGLAPNVNRMYIMIRVFIQAGKLELAVPWFEARIRDFKARSQEKAYFLFGLALSHELLGNDKDALKFAQQAVLSNPNFKDAQILTIRIALKNSALPEAKTLLARASKDYPQDPEIAVYQGVLAQKLGNTTDQTRAFNNAISLNNFVGGIISYDWLLFTTNLERYDGIKDLLVRQETLGLSLGGTNPWLGRNLWLTYAVSGRHDEALGAINKAIQIEPADDLFKLLKSVSLHKTGKSEEAALLATEAEKNLPEERLWPDTYYALGLNSLYLKKNEEAKKYLTKAATSPEAKGAMKVFQDMAKDLLKGI